ncbi:adenosylcobinamide-GDP ribazoletransferase [Oceanicoccus sp. KOV_DT_Chl]|uniref:adenosylcobinamide-GDP ribazoletransferase n=1 Tax=Oceanicoccus sp. KOV_DT_Chl TaxID=1904639 RepID=UPI000C7C9B2A|nr:adenosylcobinamide-GDP ribazoletransferase [Oceanicoccus sp. KOV_DT_Chl]
MMSIWLKAFATACIFLTRLPMPTLKTIAAEDEGRALLCFPFVGAVIGLLLCALAIVSVELFSPLLLAAILLAVWAAVTGGLHLDGLADSADGWLGGLGDIDRTLEIMHDSRCGSGALSTVVCLLIVKFAALTTIISQQYWTILFIAPILGRCVGPLLFVPGKFPYLPYVQPSGIAKHFIDHCPSVARTICWLTVALCGLLLANTQIAAIVLGSCLVMLYLLRRMMLKRLQGATGDTAGASTEIIETVVLIAGGVAIKMAPII